MNRIRIIAAVMVLAFAPVYGAAIRDPHQLETTAETTAATTTETTVRFTGTGTFTGSCQTLSGVFDFKVKATFNRGVFVSGKVQYLAIHQVNGLDVDIPEANISVTAGSIVPRNSRVDLRGSFVSPLNGGTYNFYIYGVVNGSVGAMETTGVCP
jgi:hypothetical protein